MELTQEQIKTIAGELNTMLAQQTALPQQPVATGFAPVGMTLQTAITPSILLLRVKIPVQAGETGGYIGFALPEGATAQTIQTLAQQAEMVFPIETFRPRQSGGWGNDNGGYLGGYHSNRRW